MILVQYVSPKGAIFNGLLLKREGVMIEVAFDGTPDRPLLIGWMNPTNQIGKVSMKSMGEVTWHHKALESIVRGKIEEARAMYYREEEARRQERLKKEKAT